MIVLTPELEKIMTEAYYASDPDEVMVGLGQLWVRMRNVSLIESQEEKAMKDLKVLFSAIATIMELQERLAAYEST